MNHTRLKFFFNLTHNTCLDNEMLCIQDLNPVLNVQSDSFRAKVIMYSVISLGLFYANSLQLSLFTNRFLSLLVCLIMAQDARKRQFLPLISLLSCNFKSFLLRPPTLRIKMDSNTKKYK